MCNVSECLPSCPTHPPLHLHLHPHHCLQLHSHTAVLRLRSCKVLCIEPCSPHCVLQPHLTKCSTDCGAGSSVVMMGVHLSRIYFLSVIFRRWNLRYDVVPQNVWWRLRRITWNSAAGVGWSFSDSVCFFLNNHHLSSLVFVICVCGS